MQRVHQHLKIWPACGFRNRQRGRQRFDAGEDHIFEVDGQREGRGQVREPRQQSRRQDRILAIADGLDAARAQQAGGFHQRQMIFGPRALMDANDLHIPDLHARLAQQRQQGAAQLHPFVIAINPVCGRGWRQPQVHHVEARLGGQGHQLVRWRGDQAEMGERDRAAHPPVTSPIQFKIAGKARREGHAPRFPARYRNEPA